jgi:hypothetical protein
MLLAKPGIIVDPCSRRVILHPLLKISNPILHGLRSIQTSGSVHHSFWRPFNRVTVDLEDVQTVKFGQVGRESCDFIARKTKNLMNALNNPIDMQ